jgi:hypothetical protein
MHSTNPPDPIIQISNLKSAINLNWKVFSDYILSSSSSLSESSSSQINSLVSSCKKLIDENIQTSKSIRKMKDKMTLQSNQIEILPERLINEYNEEKKENIQLQNTITSKKNIYFKLSQELEKLRNKSIFKQPKREVLIVEPNKLNVEMNNEIQVTMKIISKLNEMNKKDKETIEKLHAELIILQNKMRSLQIKYYSNRSLGIENEDNNSDNTGKQRSKSARNFSKD